MAAVIFYENYCTGCHYVFQLSLPENFIRIKNKMTFTDKVMGSFLTLILIIDVYT